MDRFKQCIFLLFFSAMGLSAYGQVSPSEIDRSLLQESVKAVLDVEDKIEWKQFPIEESHRDELSDKLRFAKQMPDTLYMGSVTKEGKNYWVIPEIAPSKSETFSYVLYLDDKEEIKDVDVLTYRESYGYEIDYPFFREQFHGISKPEKIRFRRSIQNISGATISAQSITYSVRDLLTIIKVVRKH